MKKVININLYKVYSQDYILEEEKEFFTNKYMGLSKNDYKYKKGSTDEIKGDMERLAPMDRLLCGDVGFGKTEVALRAAFKCVCDSKQCAILCPTTILAWQHYRLL